MLSTYKRTRDLTPREAQMRLDALARCKLLRPQVQDAGWTLCTADEISIVLEGSHYVHSSAEIAELRAIAADGQWPRR